MKPTTFFGTKLIVVATHICLASAGMNFASGAVVANFCLASADTLIRKQQTMRLALRPDHLIIGIHCMRLNVLRGDLPEDDMIPCYTIPALAKIAVCEDC